MEALLASASGPTLGAIFGGVGLSIYIAHSAYQAGLFVKPELDHRTFPSTRICYKLYTGAYKESSKAFTSVFAASGKDVDCRAWYKKMLFSKKKKADSNLKTIPIGIYFDDPSAIPQDKCRYLVGCTVTGEEMEKKMVSEGYTAVTLPSVKSIHTSHPFTGMMSILFIVKRVYPLIYGPSTEEERNKISGPMPCAIEFYEMEKSNAEFYLPLEKTDLFTFGLQDKDEYAESLKKKA